MVRYLWRNRIAAAVGLFRPRSAGVFDDRSRERGYLLIRVKNLPERMVDLFVATPGIEVFRPVGTSAAVAVGYAHPIDLASCQSVFPADAFHVFWPNDRVDVLPGPLALSDIAGLTRLALATERPEDRTMAAADAPNPIGVELRLAPALGGSRRVVATLIPMQHAGRLKRILFGLPPLSLRGHRVAVTDRGVLVLGSANLDVIPMGQFLCELTPGLLIPFGMDAVPRVSPEVLARALGHGPGVVTVLGIDGPPFQISESTFAPLERRSLARLDVEPATVQNVGAEPPVGVQIVNDAVGRFALWGFPEVSNRKLLPPTSGGDGTPT